MYNVLQLRHWLNDALFLQASEDLKKYKGHQNRFVSGGPEMITKSW